MNREKNLETMLVLVLMSMVLFLLLKITLILFVGLVLACIALLAKKTSGLIAGAWMRLSQGLGSLISKILLTLVFFLLLLPIALLAKLFGHNALSLSRTNQDSYFIVRHHRFTDQDMKNPW